MAALAHVELMKTRGTVSINQTSDVEPATYSGRKAPRILRRPRMMIPTGIASKPSATSQNHFQGPSAFVANHSGEDRLEKAGKQRQAEIENLIADLVNTSAA